MNFIFYGFLYGLLIVSISFQHLLVICEEILLKMQEIIFYKYFIVYNVDFSVAETK